MILINKYQELINRYFTIIPFCYSHFAEINDFTTPNKMNLTICVCLLFAAELVKADICNLCC